MNLLSKFENVKIKNDTRIAPDDIAFCEKQQNLYSKVLKNYKNIYDDLLHLGEKENTQFKEIAEENTYNRNGYVYEKYGYHFISINKEKFTEIIIGVHKIFITTIFDYFIGKYGVELNIKSVDEMLGIEEPKKIDNGYWNFHKYTEDELEKIREKNREYEKNLDEYRDKINSTEINFNTIIDNIFIQLDGYSFVDKVKKEIMDNCKNVCFNKYTKLNYVNLKKDKLVIETGFHSHFDGIWKEYEASTDNESFKAIMRALSFFDSKEKNNSIYGIWLNSFIYYKKNEKDGIYGLHSAYGNKIESFKFYKNGKWEVKFVSSEDAQNFFDIYCKSEV